MSVKFWKHFQSLFRCSRSVCGSVSLIESSLHVRNASGADGLPTKFVKVSPFMTRFITVLINKCFESSSVPV